MSKGLPAQRVQSSNQIMNGRFVKVPGACGSRRGEPIRTHSGTARGRREAANRRSATAIMATTESATVSDAARIVAVVWNGVGLPCPVATNIPSGANQAAPSVGWVIETTTSNSVK